MGAILRNFYKDQLTEVAKKQKKRDFVEKTYSNHLAWTFLAKFPNERPKAVRTYNSLFAVAEDYTYFTPNTFYRNDARNQQTLRWINALSVDIDTSGYENVDTLAVLDAIQVIGLDEPSMIVRTPSGGCHIHWVFDRPRGYSKRLVEHYARIARVLCEELNEQGLGADFAATTPERFFRLPNSENIIYQSASRPSFDQFCDWYSIEVERRQMDAKSGVICPGQNLMQAPAIKKLLQGVEKGKRDQTCYTLALAMKASGIGAKQAESRLQEWNKLNHPPMTQLEVKRKVKSAYKKDGKQGPSAFHIRQLSGMPFVYTVWEEAKNRSDRVYSHLCEWEEDLLAHIRMRGGTISGSQRDIAATVLSSADKKAMPFSTFKKVVNSLVEAGKLHKATTRGRSGCTTLTLLADTKTAENETEELSETNSESDSLNEPNSNTLIDTVAGGRSLDLDPGEVSSTAFDSPTLSTPSDLAPIPGNVPAYFVSALWNRDIRDGRVIFSLWGRVQLAFKEFGIGYRDLCVSKSLIFVVRRAVGKAIEVKGREMRFNNACSDEFLKYFYGTLKGMYSTYREQELSRFIEWIEEIHEDTLALEYGRILALQQRNDVPDREFLEWTLDEIEREISARSRRARIVNLIAPTWLDG